MPSNRKPRDKTFQAVEIGRHQGRILFAPEDRMAATTSSRAPSYSKDYAASELIERHVGGDGAAQELAEQIHRGRADGAPRVLQQIAPLERPVVDELGPLEQATDQLVAFLGVLVGAEGADLIGPRLHALVYTPREGSMHIISLRKANRREVRRYVAQAQSDTH